MSRVRVVVLLVVVSLVAGCAGDKKEAPPTSAPPSSTVEVGGNETGSIEGLVKDDELQPVAGVTVALRELSVQAESDSAGKFAFTSVPVGEYTMDAAALGYEASGQKVSVVSGETANVTFTLRQIVVVESYNQTVILTGKISCGTTAVPWCGSIQDAAGPDNPAGERYAWNFDVPEVFPAYEVYELVWTATAPGTAEKLALLYVTTDAEDPLGIHTIFSSEGASPVRGEASEKSLKAAHEAYPDSAFSLGVYPAVDGVVVDQSFTIYKTTFYGEAPPEGWSYLSMVDG